MEIRNTSNAHFKITFREKQVWFWSVFYPVLLLVIFMIIFGGTSSDNFTAKLALVERAPNPVSEGIKRGIGQIEVFDLKENSPVSFEQAEKWPKDKEIDAILVLPEADNSAELTLLLHKEKQNASSSQAIGSIVSSILLETNSGAAAANLFRRRNPRQLRIWIRYNESGILDQYRYTHGLGARHVTDRFEIL